MLLTQGPANPQGQMRPGPRFPSYHGNMYICIETAGDAEMMDGQEFSCTFGGVVQFKEEVSVNPEFFKMFPDVKKLFQSE